MTKPLKAAVIGHPINHSKSPLIHQYWLKQNNLEGTYDAIDVSSENFEQQIQSFIQENYDGFNVTIPYKERIFDLCDDIDDAAKKIGAVNTVKIENKKLYGMNTDYFGFIESIKQNCPDFLFQGKTAFVLGAGGAAKAIIYGLLQESIDKIYISNRTIERAEELNAMDSNKIKILEWENKESILNKIDLLINATSLGMVGNPPLEINLFSLYSEAVVTDIVYAPLMTDLLKQAQLQGNPIVTGIGMLLHQARPAFESWTTILPDVTSELENIVLKG